MKGRARQTPLPDEAVLNVFHFLFELESDFLHDRGGGVLFGQGLADNANLGAHFPGEADQLDGHGRGKAIPLMLRKGEVGNLHHILKRWSFEGAGTDAAVIRKCEVAVPRRLERSVFPYRVPDNLVDERRQVVAEITGGGFRVDGAQYHWLRRLPMAAAVDWAAAMKNWRSSSEKASVSVGLSMQRAPMISPSINRAVYMPDAIDW